MLGMLAQLPPSPRFPPRLISLTSLASPGNPPTLLLAPLAHVDVPIECCDPKALLAFLAVPAKPDALLLLGVYKMLRLSTKDGVVKLASV